MKRRQLLLATASLSLATFPGLSSADTDASAQTDPVQVEDVTVDLGEATLEVGSAQIAYQDGVAGVLGQDWTATVGTRSVTLDSAVLAVGNVDEETYGQLRDAAAASVGERSLSPAVSGFAAADLDPDSPVQLQAGPVSADGAPLVDEVTATGTVGGVTPENWADFAEAPLSELGSTEFSTVTAQRGDVSVTAENVVAEPGEDTLDVTAESGTAETPSRSLAFENADATFMPPEGGFPEEHQAALDGVRELAASGSLTASELRSTVEESGVTVDNTVPAVRDVRFEATVESVTEEGETLLQNFGTSGTLEELAQVVSQRL